jgi:hypothetical protein
MGVHNGGSGIMLGCELEYLETQCELNRTINADQEHRPQNPPGGEKIGQILPGGQPLEAHR